MNPVELLSPLLHGVNSRGRHAKLALARFQRHTPRDGIMQRLHFEDPRLDDAVAWMKRLAAEEFETTVAFCYTPESEGIAPHHTSPPKDPMHFADFCALMTDRHAPAERLKAVA